MRSRTNGDRKSHSAVKIADYNIAKVKKAVSYDYVQSSFNNL